MENFGPVKEKLQPVLLWIHLPRLPVKIWNEIILRHILSPIGKLYKVGHNLKEVSKVYALEFVREGILYECCGSQSHHFDFCVFNSKNLLLRLKIAAGFSS